MTKRANELIVMGYIFNPDGFDWMNIRLMKNNDYTFHHIVERKNGGRGTVENGAILTSISHCFLNILDIYFPKAYNDLQNVFIKINTSQAPPTNEIVKEMDQLLYDILYTNKYHFDEKKLTTNEWRRCIQFRSEYELSRKRLKKCLE